MPCFSRRLRYGTAGAALVALRLTACARPFSPARTVDVMTVEAGAPVVVEAEADAGAVVRAPYHDKAVLLANGHVLMPTKDVVHDWDPYGTPAFRSASLGDAGPAHTFSFVPLGGRRFLVAKVEDEAEEKNRFELWDAERLVRLKDIGVYVADTARVEFSPEGARAVIVGCTDHDGWRTCEVGVHEVASGALVHRTKIPRSRIPEDRWPTEAKLGPGGRYFVLRSGFDPIEVFDSATGRLRYRGEERAAEIWDRWYDPYAFLDDRHLLVISGDGHAQRIVDLATRMQVSITRPVNRREPSVKPWISPDHARVATAFLRDDGRSGVLVWSLVDRSTREYVAPAEACPTRCDLRWASNTSVVLTENTEEGTVQLTIDTAADTTVVEPFRKPMFFDAFGAQPVEGDFEKFGRQRWHPEDGDLVSPRGAHFALAQIDLRALTSAVGDRFFVNGLDYLRVLTADGRSAEVLPALPPP